MQHVRQCTQAACLDKLPQGWNMCNVRIATSVAQTVCGAIQPSSEPEDPR